MRMRVLVAVGIVAAMAVVCQDAFASGADADGIRKTLDGSLAKVSIYLKYDEGDAPGGGSGGGCVWLRRLGLMGASTGYDVDDERPFLTCGFVLAPDTVLVEDPMVSDRFVDRIEVEIGSKTYPAVMSGFALANRGVFLKLPQEAAGARPIAFDWKAGGPYRAVTFGPFENGGWCLQIGPLAENASITEIGEKLVQSASPALILSPKGKVVGVSMSDTHIASDAWKGSPLLWPRISAADFRAATDAVKKATDAGIVQVTINFRIKQSRRWDSSSWEERRAPTEKQVSGVLIGKGSVLVLTDLSRRETARIESMTLVRGDKTVPLTVQGALARYGAFLAGFEGEIEGASPLDYSQADLADMLDGLLIGDQLSYAKDAREERLYRERVSGIDRAYMGLLWPDTTGGSNSFVFTLDGKLAAIPISLRPQIEMQEYYGSREDSGGTGVTMPVARLAGILDDPSSVDTTRKPLSEDETKKLVWLGIEMQDITKDLARAKNVSLATKGGQVGVVVTHVYRDSPADKAEVKPGDVFVRFKMPSQVKPIDVRMRDEDGAEFPWARLDEVPDEAFERLPLPWPSQDNSLTKVLTEIGAGRKIAAEFIRDAQPRQVEFALEFGPPDYNAAASYEDKASGLTVKNVTYEVRRFFKMKDDEPGVVVADIKRGSKASVGGIKPRQMITAVNGKAVADIDEFKTAMAVGGEVSLTVKWMSRTRVAKMKLAAPEAKEEKKPEGAAPSETEKPEAAPGEGQAAPAEGQPSPEKPAGEPQETPSGGASTQPSGGESESAQPGGAATQDTQTQ